MVYGNMIFLTFELPDKPDRDITDLPPIVEGIVREGDRLKALCLLLVHDNK